MNILPKKIVVLVVVTIIGVLLGGMIASASENINSTQAVENKLGVWNTGQELVYYDMNGRVNSEQYTFRDMAYGKATDQQKVRLDEIFSDYSMGLHGEWIRDVFITIGDIPDDTPRLTIEQVTEIYNNSNFDDLESQFISIAGAPDFVGGSGIGRSIYFLNDEGTNVVMLFSNIIIHSVHDDDGNETIIPIGNQKLPEPHETKSGPRTDVRTQGPIKSTPMPQISD